MSKSEKRLPAPPGEGDKQLSEQSTSLADSFLRACRLASVAECLFSDLAGNLTGACLLAEVESSRLKFETGLP